MPSLRVQQVGDPMRVKLEPAGNGQHLLESRMVPRIGHRAEHVARIIVPLPVVAEWWRGRTDAREEILAATQIVASLEVAKAAGIALARAKDVDGRLTIDAMVMATAALMDAIVVTGDPDDFNSLARHFSGVVVLSA